MYKVSKLFRYPIKSLAGIPADSLRLGAHGFEYDRQWMLVDAQNQKLTMREEPRLCLFRQTIQGSDLTISHGGEICTIPLAIEPTNEKVSAKFFSRHVDGLLSDHRAHEWFSDLLKQKVRLIQPDPDLPRKVQSAPDHFVHYADSSQYLILGQASMDGLNRRLAVELSVDRFRANILFSGGEPHAEDHWKDVKIGDQLFKVNKLCARCTVPTIDPANAEKGSEPIRTLSTYRKWDQKIWFGTYMNLINNPGGTIEVGDEIKV